MPLISLCYFKRLYNLYDNSCMNKTRDNKSSAIKKDITVDYDCKECIKLSSNETQLKSNKTDNKNTFDIIEMSLIV